MTTSYYGNGSTSSRAEKGRKVGVQADTLYQRAAARDAKARGDRERVCKACVLPGDLVLGGIHSELPCMRCRTKPCEGAVVATKGLTGVIPGSMGGM
jgi:hypothetical protein